MYTEYIHGIFCAIFYLIILIAVLSMIIWLLYNKKKLSENSRKLYRSKVFAVRGKPGPNQKDVEKLTVKPTTPESISSLRSSLSEENLEALKPQTLMAWNTDIKTKPKEIVVRKAESINYTTFFPPIESETDKQDSNKLSEEVAFEDLTPESEKEETPVKKEPIKDKQLSAEKI